MLTRDQSHLDEAGLVLSGRMLAVAAERDLDEGWLWLAARFLQLLFSLQSVHFYRWGPRSCHLFLVWYDILGTTIWIRLWWDIFIWIFYFGFLPTFSYFVVTYITLCCHTVTIFSNVSAVVLKKLHQSQKSMITHVCSNVHALVNALEIASVLCNKHDIKILPPSVHSHHEGIHCRLAGDTEYSWLSALYVQSVV